MKKHKKNTRPDVGASERARGREGTGRASRQGRASTHNDTTAGPLEQVFRVTDKRGGMSV